MLPLHTHITRCYIVCSSRVVSRHSVIGPPATLCGKTGVTAADRPFSEHRTTSSDRSRARPSPPLTELSQPLLPPFLLRVFHPPLPPSLPPLPPLSLLPPPSPYPCRPARCATPPSPSSITMKVAMPFETPRVQGARMDSIRDHLAARGLPGGPLVRACVRACALAPVCPLFSFVLLAVGTWGTAAY